MDLPLLNKGISLLCPGFIGIYTVVVMQGQKGRQEYLYASVGHVGKVRVKMLTVATVIKMNNVRNNLRFSIKANDPVEAAQVYDKAALRYFWEFARTKFR